jgi:hypothetical protein
VSANLRHAEINSLIEPSRSCRRATSAITAPGAIASATIRPFSPSLHRRRRTTPVTSAWRRTIFASSLMSTIMCTRSTIPRITIVHRPGSLSYVGEKHRLHSISGALRMILGASQPLPRGKRSMPSAATPSRTGTNVKQGRNWPRRRLGQCAAPKPGWAALPLVRRSQNKSRPQLGGFVRLEFCSLEFRALIELSGAVAPTSRRRTRQLAPEVPPQRSGLERHGHHHLANWWPCLLHRPNYPVKNDYYKIHNLWLQCPQSLALPRQP